jgi:hypothetical protein
MSIPRLWLLCAALVCLVGAEWRWSGGDAAPSPSMLTTALGRSHQAAAARQSADPDKVVAIILGRPLFSPSRRPASTAVDAAAGQRDASLPKLSGIIDAPDLRRAIFQAQGSGKPIVSAVGEGQTINNWTVRYIRPESVTLIRGGQTALLTPTFGTIVIQPPPRPRPTSRWVAAARSGILRARWANPQLQP